MNPNKDAIERGAPRQYSAEHPEWSERQEVRQDLADWHEPNPAHLPGAAPRDGEPQALGQCRYIGRCQRKATRQASLRMQGKYRGIVPVCEPCHRMAYIRGHAPAYLSRGTLT